MKKPSILLIMLLIAICILTVSVNSREKSVELRFMWWGSDSRHKATIEAIELFQKKYSNIKVKPEFSDWGGYNEKLTTAFMNKNVADLFQINWNILYLFGAGDFYDLKNTGLDLNNYSPDLIKQCTIDGKVIGIPNSTNGRVFFYNKATYDKIGLPIPKSFAELFTAGKIFRTILGDDYYPLFLNAYDSWLIALMYCEQKYGKPFILENKVVYSVEELKSGLDFYSALVDDGVVPSIAEAHAVEGLPYDRDPRWITGKFAGVYNWSASTPKISGSVTNGEIVIGETPMDYGKTPGCIYKISHCYAIYGKTKHPKEVTLLFNFLLTDPDAIKILGLERGIPSNKSAVDVLNRSGLLTGLAYDAQIAADKSAGMGISPHFEDSELQKFYRTEVIQMLPSIGSATAAERAIIKTNEYLKLIALEEQNSGYKKNKIITE
jgi:oligogalacturonide transport system substrate-binding protein